MSEEIHVTTMEANHCDDNQRQEEVKPKAKSRNCGDVNAHDLELRRVYVGFSGGCYVTFLALLTLAVFVSVLVFVYTSDVRPYPGPGVGNRLGLWNGVKRTDVRRRHTTLQNAALEVTGRVHVLCFGEK